MKIPQIRFSGYTADWEQCKLLEIANHRGGTAIEKYFDKKGVYKVISIGSYGLDSKYIDQNIRAISNEVTDGRVVHKGELTMVLNDKTANGTIIGRSLLIDADNEYVINQRTEIISPKENFDSVFAYVELNGPFREKVRRIVQGGTQIYVNYSVVENLNVVLPSIEEQQQIGAFFQTLDNLITLHQREYKKTINIKNAMLEKLFPKDGVKVPEIRFEGFADDWEQCKLGKITDIKTGSSDLQDAEPEGIYPFFVRSENVERSNRFIHDGEAILIPGEGRLGDIYHYIEGKFDYHQRVYKISGFKVSETYGKFILFSMQKGFKRHALKYTVKATVDSLRLPMLANFELMIPKFEEQQKIGNFFTQLDNLITLHQREYEKMVNMKKALLERMFPKEGE